MEPKNETEHERRFREWENKRWQLYYEGLVEESLKERERQREMSIKLRRNLKTAIVTTLICGSLFTAGLYLNSRLESLTPEQRRDSSVMFRNRQLIEAYEIQVGNAIHWKDFEKARGIYRYIMNNFCPSESDIGKRCKERYEEDIFDLNRREIRDFY